MTSLFDAVPLQLVTVTAPFLRTVNVLHLVLQLIHRLVPYLYRTFVLRETSMYVLVSYLIVVLYLTA